MAGVQFEHLDPCPPRTGEECEEPLKAKRLSPQTAYSAFDTSFTNPPASAAYSDICMKTLGMLLLLCSLPCLAQSAREIDATNSRLTVFAYKSGMFSFAAHDHQISAPIASGRVDDSEKNPSVTLHVNAKEMKVLDPDVSEKDRATIQHDMHAKVLASEQFPEIEFVSTSITRTAPDRWTAVGNLSLHGKTKPVTVSVERTGGRFTGSAKLKQTDFGITPISVAGGTVKVKDELKVTFEIAVK